MVRQKYDLAYVIGIVFDLTVDRLQDGVLLSANPHAACQVTFGEWINCLKNAVPTRIPPSDNLLRSRGRIKHEFVIAVSVRLFATAQKKVGPARAHVARPMFHDGGSA